MGDNSSGWRLQNIVALVTSTGVVVAARLVAARAVMAARLQKWRGSDEGAGWVQRLQESCVAGVAFGVGMVIDIAAWEVTLLGVARADVRVAQCQGMLFQSSYDDHSNRARVEGQLQWLGWRGHQMGDCGYWRKRATDNNGVLVHC